VDKPVDNSKNARANVRFAPFVYVVYITNYMLVIYGVSS